MTIYQGEPIGFKFNIKDDECQYLPSFEDMQFEALVSSENGKVVKTWSTEDGSITVGTETIGSAVRGFASFSITGGETSTLCPGTYTYEMAKVLDDGRAIGVLKGVIKILPALIRNGV